MAELVRHRPAKSRSSVIGCRGSNPRGVACEVFMDTILILALVFMVGVVTGIVLKWK